MILHRDPKAPAHLLGIWAPPTIPNGQPRSWYPEEQAAARQLADATMHEDGGRRTWEQLAAYLAQASPYTAWWDDVEVEDSGDLPALYRRLVEQVFDTTAAGHGTTTSAGDLTLTVNMLTAEDQAIVAGPAFHIAHQLGFDPPKKATNTTGRLSSLLHYFDDADRLLVVAADLGRPEAADLALAHGLAQAGHRDLWIVVPEGHAAPVVRRAPFFDRKIRIWTWDWTAFWDRKSITELMLPAPAEIFALLATDGLASETLDIGERQTWVSILTDWADNAPLVTPNHRRSYLAWHCNGLRILEIAPSKGNQLRITAGVQHAAAAPDAHVVDGPLTAALAHRLVSAAAAACAASLDGSDPAPPEHRLQAALLPKDLNLLEWRKEFPARRPVAAGGTPTLGGDRRGFIDFLGIDSDGDIHIVETKLGGDERLVLQALDYWTWAMGHRHDLAKVFRHPVRNVVIDFVVGPAQPDGLPIGPYTAEQAESLSGEIGWRFWTITDLEAPDPTPHHRRTVPPNAPRRVPAGVEPWSPQLHDHLRGKAADKGLQLASGIYWPQKTTGLTAPAAQAAAQLISAGLDHRMLGHVRSSQAFALNLFASLDEPGRLAVLHHLGIDSTACPPPTFEWSDPLDRLAEATTTSPHQTQVDVILRPTTADGHRHLVFIEVKLSETDFGHCSAYLSPHNPDRSPCRGPHPFGADPSACFQLRNHDRGRPRTYLAALEPVGTTPGGCGCWFRLGNNQAMRNVALGRSLIQAGDVDRVTLALCAPLGHRAIWRRWNEARTALTEVHDVDMRDLPADAVAAYLPLLNGLELADRYLLDLPAVRRFHANVTWQQWADGLFPYGAAYVLQPDLEDPPNAKYIGKVTAEADGEKVAVTIAPHSIGYNPTTFHFDPAGIPVERIGDGVQIDVGSDGYPKWLMSPQIAPGAMLLGADDLPALQRSLPRMTVGWLPSKEPEPLPHLGVGA